MWSQTVGQSCVEKSESLVTSSYTVRLNTLADKIIGEFAQEACLAILKFTYFAKIISTDNRLRDSAFLTL